MDVNSVFVQGGVKIPNPKYSKSKKSSEPKYLTVTDLDRAIDTSGSAMADVAFDAAGKHQDIIGDSNEIEKNEKYGITVNKYDTPESIAAQLAEHQSNISKTVNALGQTIINEGLLGIPLGISDICDLVIGGAIRTMTGEENDYSNPISDFLREKQKEFEEIAPIHVDPNGSTLYDQFTGGLNWGYWMNNLPSIASTITLMAPGMGAAKAGSMISKAMKIRKAVRGLSRAKKTLESGNELNWLQKAMISRSNAKVVNAMTTNAVNATAMRMAENYQEAVQTNEESYKYNIDFLNGLTDEEYADWINKNPHLKDLKGEDGNPVNVADKDAVAKAVAREAAAQTFRWDMANIVFDVMQVYGLRNAGNLYKRTFKNSNKVLQANRESIKNINKTAEEIAKEAAAKSWITKGFEKVRGTAKGNLMLIGSEASEGLEEAVNYVSQEEGLNYGKVLLGTVAESSFDDRFAKYWNSPQLWDSAFWGVLGGVGFHKVGSAFNAIGRKIEHSRKKKGDDTTKESLAWYDFGLDNETEDRINDIAKRDQRTKIYADRVSQIKGTVDPATGEYTGGINPATGEAITKDEADILLRQAEDEYLTDLYLNAAKNGNLGLLKDFLKSDEVATFFANNGLGGATQEDIDARIEKLDKIESLFEDNLRRVDMAASTLGKGSKLFAYDVDDEDSKKAIEKMFSDAEVPVEYLMMIAENNVRAQLKLEDYTSLATNERANAERELNELKSLGKIDTSLNYESIVKLGVLSHQLGLLRLQREEIESDPNKAKSLSGQISLDNITKEEKLIKDLIYNEQSVNNDDAIANLIFALGRSNSFVKLQDGNIGTVRGNRRGVSSSFDSFLDMIGAVQDASGNYTNFENLDAIIIGNSGNTQAIAQKVNQLQESHSTVFSDKIDSMHKIAPTAVDSLSNAAMLEYLIEQEKANISLTPDEVTKEIGEINNSMVEARTHAIDNSISTLQTLFDKYALEDEDSLEELDALLYGNNDAHITSRMDDKDKADWSSAMKVLNLTNRNNSSLKRQVRDILSRRAMIKAMMDAGAANVGGVQQTQTSTTSQSPVLEPTPDNLINQSETLQTQTGEAANAQIEEVAPQKRVSVGLTINSDGTIKETDNANNQLPIQEFDDGSYEITIPNDGSHADLLTNEKLFDIRKSIVDGGQVVENPILDVDDDGNVMVVKQGLITDPNVAQPQQQLNPEETPKPAAPSANLEQQGSPAAITSSTGVLENSNPQRVEGTYNLSLSDATTKVRTALFKEVKTDTDLDALGQSLVDDLIKEGLTKAEATNIVSSSLPMVKSMRAKLSGAKAKSVEAIAKLQESNALFADKPDDETTIANFEEAFKNVISQYAADMKLNKINGRYYIVTQDLLRYCNDICEDKLVADILYDSVVRLINNTGGNTIDYVIIDKADLTSDGFLKRVANSVEANLSSESQLSDHRVDIMSILRDVPKEERESIYKELEKLNVGDRLYYEINGDYILIKAGAKKANRKTIGRLPLPRREDGKYVWINRNWSVDVNLDSNNKPVSRLKDFFTDIFAPAKEDKEAQYFNNLLMEYTFGLPADAKKRAARQKEILDELAKIYATDRFKKFIVGELNDKTVKNLTDMLRNLYGPMTAATNANVNGSDRRRIVTASLNSWFNKLYESYDFANILATKKTGSIKVSQIHKGRPRFTSGTTRHIVSEALTSENLSSAKVAVSTYDGTIKTSDGSDTGISAPYGNTYVILQNGTDKVTVKAWPVSLTRPNKSNKIAQIQQAIEKEIDAAIDAYAKDHNYDRLFNFVDNLFGVYVPGVKAPSNNMFISAKDDNKKSKVHAISLQNNLGMKIYFGDKSVTIYRTYSSGASTSNKVQFNDDSRAQHASGEKTNAKLKQAFREMLKDLNYNINFNHMSSTTFTSGFVSRDAKGKFSIKIGDSKAIKFNSYEDFLVANDLVELSIETNEDRTSNFYRLGEEIEDSIEHNKAGQFLRVKLDGKTTTPNRAIQPKVSEVNTDEIKDKVDAVLNSNKTDSSADGVAVISEVAPEIVDSLTNIEYQSGTISLLPDKLVLDSEMKEVAAFNRTTGITRISKRTYDNLTSQNKATVYKGVKSLIHEKIHDILHRDGNAKYVDQVREVYEEAKDAIAKMLVDNNLPNPFVTDENGRITDASLEEFITYSLTDSRFANLLNSIDSEGNTVDRSNMSILQKIMDIISKLFGWGIRDNSLYAKEFNALRDIMNIEDNTSAETNTEVEETQGQDINSTENKENLTDDLGIEDESFSIFDESLVEETNDIKLNAINLDNALKQIPMEDRNSFIDDVKSGVVTQICN